MNQNFRLLLNIFSALCIVVLVFMYYIGYWKHTQFAQNLFFFIMVIAIFNVGVEVGKNIKKNNNWL